MFDELKQKMRTNKLMREAESLNKDSRAGVKRLRDGFDNLATYMELLPQDKDIVLGKMREATTDYKCKNENEQPYVLYAFETTYQIIDQDISNAHTPDEIIDFLVHYPLKFFPIMLVDKDRTYSESELEEVYRTAVDNCFKWLHEYHRLLFHRDVEESMRQKGTLLAGMRSEYMTLARECARLHSENPDRKYCLVMSDKLSVRELAPDEYTLDMIKDESVLLRTNGELSELTDEVLAQDFDRTVADMKDFTVEMRGQYGKIVLLSENDLTKLVSSLKGEQDEFLKQIKETLKK